MEQATAETTVDWSERRSLLGREFYTWQVNLFALLFVVFVAFVSFTFASPFIPLFVAQLGVDDPGHVAIWSGVILGMGPIGAVITGPFWGRLADRIGGRVTLSRTVFGFALLSAIMAFSTDVPQLAFLRLAMGLLGGFTTVAVAMASMSSPPEWTTRSIGLIQSAQIVSYMVGPALGGIMADQVGIRPTFLASGVLAALAGINLVIIYREPVAMQQHREATKGQKRQSVPWRAIFATPFFLPLFLVLFAGNFIDRSFQPLVPLYVAFLEPNTENLATIIGLIVAAGALAATVSANVVGRLLNRFSHQQMLFGSLLLGGIGCAFMAVTGNVWQFGLLRLEVGLFAGGVLTLAYGLGGALIPIDRRASAFGVLASGAMLGSAVSPIAGGLMAAFSLPGAFVLNAVICVVAALVVWFGMGLRRSAHLEAAAAGMAVAAPIRPSTAAPATAPAAAPARAATVAPVSARVATPAAAPTAAPALATPAATLPAPAPSEQSARTAPDAPAASTPPVVGAPIPGRIAADAGGAPATGLPAIVAHLDARPGERVLLRGATARRYVDVLAAVTGPAGRVAGIDGDGSGPDPCACSADAAGGPAACAACRAVLPYFSGTFDRALLLSYFGTQANPRQAAADVSRVLRAGGVVLAREPDWATLTLAPDPGGLTRRIAEAWCAGRPFGALGRELPALLHDAGIRSVDVSADPALRTGRSTLAALPMLDRLAARSGATGAVPAEDAAAWLADARSAAEDGTLVFSVTRFVATGRR